jgi:GAF domain-containing protein/two-component sensor histidine kinase
MRSGGSAPGGARGRRRTPSRLSETLVGLSDALAGLAAERALNSVLQRIADLAREVAGARYAALGVADSAGRIQEFITSGLTPQARAAIGPLPRGHGLLGVLIREGRPVRVPKISADPRSSGFPPNHPPMTSLLGVPIVLNDRVLGDLYLTDKLEAAELDERGFDEDDERLALLLARHAGVAIENARLNDELERRLEQVSSLREFGQAIGQELDVERALQVVVERSAELLNAALVAIALKDPNGDAYTFEAAAGRRARRLLGLRVSGSASMIGWVAREGHGAIVDDVAHDERVSLRVLEAVGGRAGLWAPLRTGHRFIGCIMAFDRLSGEPFTQADLQLAEAIGQQAAAAIENARLYERALHEASTSQALLRVTRAMNASIRLEEILQLIVDSLSELIGTPAVAVSLLAADGVQFEVAATRALTQPPALNPSTEAGGASSPTDMASSSTDTDGRHDGHSRSAGRSSGDRVSSLAPLVVGGEGPSVVADTRDRPDLVFPTLRDGSTPRSVAISPIRLSERVLGVVEAYSTEPSHFSEQDTALLAAFADQAATAIETARLFGQARELALLQERDRIAKELHDGIIQTIYAVGLNLDYCRLTLRENPDDVEARLGDATAGLNRAISDIRNYILHLTHRVGAVVGLREAAEGLAREYEQSGGPGHLPVSIAVDIGDDASTAAPAERRAELGQVLREALANAVRHARASSITIAGRVEGGRLILTVADDGIGFDTTAGSTEEHHGLRNMSNRARLLEGHLEIDSAPGRGTTITIVVPLTA